MEDEEEISEAKQNVKKEIQVIQKKIQKESY